MEKNKINELIDEIKTKDRLITVIKDYMGRDNFEQMINLNRKKIYSEGE